MATFERFEDLDAWKEARALVRSVYGITSTGEFARDFVLRDQIRRAASSRNEKPETKNDYHFTFSALPL
jgi:hypothetical protein